MISLPSSMSDYFATSPAIRRDPEFQRLIADLGAADSSVDR